MKEKALIVIPARMASTRLPGKPLAKVAGKTLLERVCLIAKSARGPFDIIVATDDPSIFSLAESIGVRVSLTKKECRNGSERVLEISRKFPEYTVFFSLQADAILTPPWILEELFHKMASDPKIPMATPAVLLEGKALQDFLLLKKRGSTSGTCVVFNKKNEALYFSKALIPYHREKERPHIFRHIGLYAYRPLTLQSVYSLEKSPLEKLEKLEQLRALENGVSIRVVIVDYRGRTHGSIDTFEDIATLEKVILEEGELCHV